MRRAWLRPKLAAVLVTFGVAGAAGHASLTIDNFRAGAVHLIAHNEPGQHGTYADLLESGLPAGDTINGRRLTWVEAGQDSDPAIAQSVPAAMRFQLDNDECRGGLKYLGLGGVDLTQGGFADRIDFEINYEHNGSESTVVAILTVRDTLARTQELSQEIAAHLPGGGLVGYSGTYGFNLVDCAPVDMTHLQDIELRFSGGARYFGQFDVGSIAAVPEPASLVMLGLLAIRRSRNWRRAPAMDRELA